jgi:hypothetical protein
MCTPTKFERDEMVFIKEKETSLLKYVFEMRCLSGWVYYTVTYLNVFRQRFPNTFL